MKCPKCGYNSFDHLDSCKKCGKDLVSFKKQYGIKSVLFPGQMKPALAAAETEVESVVGEEFAAEAAVAASAATATAAGSVTAEDFEVPPTGGGDDFGFDFMGESEGEEDLSFDELFEEAPADEDVEETLPEPEKEKQATETEDDFDFALGSEEDDEDNLPSEEELAEDFGFDIDEAADEKASGQSGEGESDLPPEEDEDFDFSEEKNVFEDAPDQASGTEEDPKDPFEVPGSFSDAGVPESTVYVFEPIPQDAIVAAEAEDDFSTSGLTEGEVLGATELQATPPSELPNIAPSAEIRVPREELLSAEEVESRDHISPGLFPEAGDEPGSELSEEPIEFPQFQESSAAGENTEIPEPSPPEESLSATVAGPAVEDVAASATAYPEDQAFHAGPVSVNEADLRPPVGSRVFAFASDLMLLLVVGTSFIFAAEAVMSTNGERLLPSAETLIDLSIPYFLVLFSLAFGYFTLFHFLAGQTPGKMLTGLRVETLTGEPLSFSQAFLRSVGGLLQLLPIGLGYLVILISSDRRGWNDQLAGTRLINLKRLPSES